ncbi:hypothetical protein [Nocardia acidivorans]|nr:hypothetical protein [Nocardia acidivorans]
MRNRQVGTAWQRYLYPGSRASHWIRLGVRVGVTFFVLTIAILTYAVLS